MLQLPKHHGPVLHLVVQLEALDKILVGAGILGLLHLAVDREELGTQGERETVSSVSYIISASILRFALVLLLIEAGSGLCE